MKRNAINGHGRNVWRDLASATTGMRKSNCNVILKAWLDKRVVVKTTGLLNSHRAARSSSGRRPNLRGSFVRRLNSRLPKSSNRNIIIKAAQRGNNKFILVLISRRPGCMIRASFPKAKSLVWPKEEAFASLEMSPTLVAISTRISMTKRRLAAVRQTSSTILESCNPSDLSTKPIESPCRSQWGTSCRSQHRVQY